jgi:hypothetical protein
MTNDSGGTVNLAVLKSAAVKALRTFVQAFLATLAVSASGIVDVSTGRAAVVAAVSAGIAAAWRAALDTLPVPTLVDRNNEAGVPATG